MVGGSSALIMEYRGKHWASMVSRSGKWSSPPGLGRSGSSVFWNQLNFYFLSYQIVRWQCVTSMPPNNPAASNFTIWGLVWVAKQPFRSQAFRLVISIFCCSKWLTKWNEINLVDYHTLNSLGLGSTNKPVQFLLVSKYMVFDKETPSNAPASIKNLWRELPSLKPNLKKISRWMFCQVYSIWR